MTIYFKNYSTIKFKSGESTVAFTYGADLIVVLMT